MMIVMSSMLPDGLQENVPGVAGAWERVWQRQEKTWAAVKAGRAIYNRFFFDSLKPYLTAETRMIELGCGTASLGRMCSPHLESYTGLDASPIAIEQARSLSEEFGNMTFVQRDLYDPQSDTYDLVWSQGLIEHFVHGHSAIERHLDYCAPGGTVVISVPAAGSYLEKWYRATRKGKMRPLWPWTDQKFFTEQTLAALLDDVPAHRYATYHIERLRPHASGIILLVIRLHA